MKYTIDKCVAIIVMLPFLFITSLCAQSIHYAEYGDTRYMTLDSSSGYLSFELKDTLADGIWFVYMDKCMRCSKKRMGNIVAEAHYSNQLRNGAYVKYIYKSKGVGQSTNRKVIKSHYSNGILDGSFQIWDDTILQCSGTYDNGLKVGVWHSYNAQSGYTLESRYSKDTIISIREIKHGVVKTECNFETNTYRAYNDSSILIVLTIFSLDSGAYTIKYDENGNKIAEGCGRFYEAHVIQGYCARGYNLALQWRNECGTWIYYDTKGNIIKED